jgi:hypothetical protein
MSTLREAAQQVATELRAEITYTSQGTPQSMRDEWMAEMVEMLETALEQPEQTITPAELSAALGWPGGISTPVLGKVELLRMVASAALAQQEQEPVASIYVTIGGEREFDDWRCPLPVGRNLLYTHPPRQWRGLKEWEIKDRQDQLPTEDLCNWSFRQGVYFAEKSLKERNT